MTPERLKQVEEIYHQILEYSPPLRNKALNDSCGDDIELKKEVESLLSFDKTFDNFIDTPPESLIKEVFSNQKNLQLIGSKINQYEIVSIIGEGGMGTVYLAEDKKLERKTAIKFLSEKFLVEKNLLTRFFIEAKSASALNHPNIITVYEIGEFENRPFIATEFIDGVTLKEYQLRNSLMIKDIVEIAIQICSALSTAHKAGIIHRDIKPENIMIRGDGIIKVLDFGLAKLNQNASDIDTEANTKAKFLTTRGMVMGTPQFMSPEQARGKTVDTRTDIWSFGVLLYQMLAKRMPFDGESVSDVIAAILKSEPPPLNHISPKLQNIVLKTLKKNRDERYQTFEEVSDDLKKLKREIEFDSNKLSSDFQNFEQDLSEKNTDAKYVRTTVGNSAKDSFSESSFINRSVLKVKEFPVQSLLIFSVVAIITTILGFGISKFISNRNSSEVFLKMQLAKLTFDGAATNSISVSPDGKYVAYASKDDKVESLFVKQVATGSVVEIVSPTEVVLSGITFSNDGNYIYYTANDSLSEIPALGGKPRKIANNVKGKISLSPDGKSLAFLRSNSLFIADDNGESERFIAQAPPEQIWRQIDWNPNGNSITVSTSNANSAEYFIDVKIENGETNRLDSNNWLIISGFNWLSDGSGIFLSGSNAETKTSQLWFLPFPNGELRHITNDFSSYVGAEITVDSKNLVSVKKERLFNIWVSNDGTESSLKKITLEEGKDDGLSGVTYTQDGKIIYTVRINDDINIWSINSDGTSNRQLTFNQSSNYQPEISPDSKYIVFTSNRNGKMNIWRMNVDGSEQTVLTDSSIGIDSPKFTPDGKWLLYRQLESTSLSTIWKLDIKNNQKIQLTTENSNRVTISPDGKYFICEYGKPAKLALFSINGGQPLKFLDLPSVLKSRMYHWGIDGKSLIYIEKRNRIDNIWMQPISGESPKQLTSFASGQIIRFDQNPDGKGFAYSRGNDSSDIVMFSDIKQ